MSLFCLFMKQRPPISTRTDTPLPYTTLVRSPFTSPAAWPTANGVSASRPHRRRTPRDAGPGNAFPRAPLPETDDHEENQPRGTRRLLCRSGKRSEEHTSELQSPMRISYAVFCLTKKTETKLKTTSAG